MRYSPIIISVYDRLEHLQRCISSLLANKLAIESDLFIISDAPYKKEDESNICNIRNYILGIKGFKNVHCIFRDKNLGGHNSIIDGITSVLKNHDSFIFLEDDIVVSCDFLQYMNDGLLFYKDDSNIFSICGFKHNFQLPFNYNAEIYFYPCSSPWGFATWRDRWITVNHEYYDRYSELKKNKMHYDTFTSIGFYIKGILQADSRGDIEASDLRVYYHMFKNSMCSVFPTISKTQNWGFDGTGEHCGNKEYVWAKPKLDTRTHATLFELFNGYDEELLRSHRKFQDKINGGWFAGKLKYTKIHQVWKRIKPIIIKYT